MKLFQKMFLQGFFLVLIGGFGMQLWAMEDPFADLMDGDHVKQEVIGGQSNPAKRSYPLLPDSPMATPVANAGVTLEEIYDTEELFGDAAVQNRIAALSQEEDFRRPAGPAGRRPRTQPMTGDSGYGSLDSATNETGDLTNETGDLFVKDLADFDENAYQAGHGPDKTAPLSHMPMPGDQEDLLNPDNVVDIESTLLELGLNYKNLLEMNLEEKIEATITGVLEKLFGWSGEDFKNVVALEFELKNQGKDYTYIVGHNIKDKLKEEFIRVSSSI